MIPQESPMCPLPLLSVENFVPLPVVASQPLKEVFCELRASPGGGFAASPFSQQRGSPLSLISLRCHP